MSVRAHIAALLLWAGLSLAALAAVTFFALGQAGYFAERVALVHTRLVVLAAIDGRANQYGENVASVLLLNRRGLEYLQASRVLMEREFARLSQATRDEIGRLAGMEALQEELPELDTARRMAELYHAIDRSTARLLILLREGKQEEAREVFNLEVAFRLANELQPLIDSEMEGEQREVLELQSEAEGAQQNFGLLALAVGGVGLIGLLALAISGWRGVRQEESRTALHIKGRDEDVREAGKRVSGLEMRRAQFLADISHELRTPVTILRGEADIALRGSPDSAEMRGSLERIQGQAAEIGELLEDLIGYARADSEEQEFRTAVVDASEIVHAAVDEGMALGEPREVTIAAENADEVVLIHADQRRLKRVLLIGIDNAVKHSAPGSTVAVRMRREDQAVVLEVLDDGMGVDVDEKPKVFERFFRGRGERELQNRGIGIGLAIAREIVELHRGKISLDNRPEGGAVLTITLPVGGTA